MNPLHRNEPAQRPSWLRPDLGLGRDVGLLFWGHFFHAGGFAIQMALWTLFIGSLGASSAQIGYVVGGGAIARTLLVIPAGALVDRISQKPVIVFAMSMPVIGAAILVMATAWWHALVGALFIEMSGLAIPAVSSYIAVAANPAERTRAYTYVYSIAAQTGMTIAPVGGGFVAEAFGYRPVYALSGLVLGIAVVFFALLGQQRQGEGDETTATSPAVGFRDVMRMPAVWIVAGVHLLVPLLPYIGLSLLPNFLVDERGLSLGTIGTLASVGSAAGLAFSVVVSHWSPLGRPFFGIGVCLGMVSAALGLFLLSGFIGVIVVAYMLRGAMGPVWSLMAAAVADVTPERIRGRAYGVCELGAGVGDVSAPVLSGQLYGVDHRLPLTIAFVTTMPLAALAFGLHRLRARLVRAAVAQPPVQVTATSE